MANIRKIVFANDYYYHIFNRGMDRRTTYSDKREYDRAIELLYFYNFKQIPLRFSRFNFIPIEKQREYMEIMTNSGEIVDIVAYCLMPNHYHLLLRQKTDDGISTFISNFTNAYTRYFNTKNKRIGSLFQGVFKAVYIENEEQLLHLTRYIHLNPVIGSIVAMDNLESYLWSSYPAYINKVNDALVNKPTLQMIRQAISDYETFLKDQVSYAKELKKIKELILE